MQLSHFEKPVTSQTGAGHAISLCTARTCQGAWKCCAASLSCLCLCCVLVCGQELDCSHWSCRHQMRSATCCVGGLHQMLTRGPSPPTLPHVPMCSLLGASRFLRGPKSAYPYTLTPGTTARASPLTSCQQRSEPSQPHVVRRSGPITEIWGCEW